MVFFLCHTVDKKYIFSVLFFFLLVFTLLVDLFDLLRTSFIKKKMLEKNLTTNLNLCIHQ